MEIYRAGDAPTAEKTLKAFEAGEWGKEYAATGRIGAGRESKWCRSSTFPKMKIGYITNAVEALIFKIRSAFRARGHFPSDDDVMNRHERGMRSHGHGLVRHFSIRLVITSNRWATSATTVPGVKAAAKFSHHSVELQRCRRSNWF